MEPSFAVSSAVIGAPPQVSTSAPMQRAGIDAHMNGIRGEQCH
jgi:hypothetical protein